MNQGKANPMNNLNNDIIGLAKGDLLSRANLNNLNNNINLEINPDKLNGNFNANKIKGNMNNLDKMEHSSIQHMQEMFKSLNLKMERQRMELETFVKNLKDDEMCPYCKRVGDKDKESFTLRNLDSNRERTINCGSASHPNSNFSSPSKIKMQMQRDSEGKIIEVNENELDHDLDNDQNKN